MVVGVFSIAEIAQLYDWLRVGAREQDVLQLDVAVRDALRRVVGFGSI